jgi:hypothetical protein
MKCFMLLHELIREQFHPIGGDPSYGTFHVIAENCSHLLGQCIVRVSVQKQHLVTAEKYYLTRKEYSTVLRSVTELRSLQQ